MSDASGDRLDGDRLEEAEEVAGEEEEAEADEEKTRMASVELDDRVRDERSGADDGVRG